MCKLRTISTNIPYSFAQQTHPQHWQLKLDFCFCLRSESTIGFVNEGSSGYCSSKNAMASACAWHLIAATFQMDVAVQVNAWHRLKFWRCHPNQPRRQFLASVEKTFNRGFWQDKLQEAKTHRRLRVEWRKGLLQYAPIFCKNGFVALHRADGCRNHAVTCGDTQMGMPHGTSSGREMVQGSRALRSNTPLPPYFASEVMTPLSRLTLLIVSGPTATHQMQCRM